jgi:phosphoribosylformimino-5-aminoimidazole carboxamide ribotide isomerase
MNSFAVIPVIDLKGGAVVHARGGARETYRPIETPLGPANDPIAIARALIGITQSPMLYVADLDAIENCGDHFQICRDLADVLPTTQLWIDAGFSTVADCAFWLPLGATLVVGSESLGAVETWHSFRTNFGQSLILSLDFGADGFRGPGSLLAEAAAWPERIIAMSLPNVGAGRGPDLERLTATIGSAGPRAVYAAGGVRSIGDLDAIAAAGASGALVATALHRGAIGQKEIAAFERRRRSQSD